mgnify:CR=1 FL=1
MIQDMVEAFDALAESAAISRLRYGSDVNDLGRVIRGTLQSSTAITAVVVPAPAEEIQRLDEHVRTRRVIQVFSRDEWKIASDAEQRRADRATYDGDTFEVQSVDRWRAGGFYAALLVRVTDA